MQKEAQQHEVEQQGKRHYEKPLISAVRLFADHVLQCDPNTSPEGDGNYIAFS
jgi:hypothetical protein